MSDIITLITDFKPSNLTFTKAEETETSNGQLISYARYNNNGTEKKLFLQLPWIPITAYGVPTLGQYYKTDDDRKFLKLPLDSNIEDVNIFINKIKELDENMQSDEIKKNILGKKYAKYRYVPTYREPSEVEDDDDDDNIKKKKNTVVRLPAIKLKLDLSYPDKNIKTGVCISEIDKETGKVIERTEAKITSINDFTNYVKYLSKVRCIIKPTKLWAQSATLKEPTYGISFTLVKIEVEKRDNMVSVDSSSIDFYDVDSIVKSTKNMKIESLNETKKYVSDSDDSDSDEEIIKKEDIKKPVVADIDSDDSSDEEVIKKPVVIAEVDSDDSDEEVVVTKSKKSEKKPVKKAGKK